MSFLTLARAYVAVKELHFRLPLKGNIIFEIGENISTNKETQNDRG